MAWSRSENLCFFGNIGLTCPPHPPPPPPFLLYNLKYLSWQSFIVLFMLDAKWLLVDLIYQMHLSVAMDVKVTHEWIDNCILLGTTLSRKMGWSIHVCIYKQLLNSHMRRPTFFNRSSQNAADLSADIFCCLVYCRPQDNTDIQCNTSEVVVRKSSFWYKFGSQFFKVLIIPFSDIKLPVTVTVRLFMIITPHPPRKL